MARVHEEGLPDGSLTDAANVYGCGAARTLVQVLKQCGDNLTRDNRTKQAADLKDFDTGVALPGIRIDTGPADYAPIESVQPVRFDGETWVPLGEVMGR